MTGQAAVAEPVLGGEPATGSRRRADSPWIPVASAIGVAALAFWSSAHKSIWVDEAYTLLTAGNSVAGTWHQAVHFELQPPLYFLVIHLWLKLGPPTIEW